jgi:hypothetical protein
MTPHPFLTRRTLIRDMGKAGLAAVILEPAACSSKQGEATTTTQGLIPETAAVLPASKPGSWRSE